MLKLGHRALFSETSPECLKLSRYNPQRTLRSSNAPLLQITLVKRKFQDTMSNLFNALSKHVRSCPDLNIFKRCFKR